MNEKSCRHTNIVIGEKWIDKAGTAFNENFNCLTYYNSLVQTHFK